MKLKPKDRKALVEAAIGKRKCDIVIKNAKIVNVFTGEIYTGNVGIYDGFIAHVECNPDNISKDEPKLEGKTYYDAHGKFLIPGFIDPHMHVESTMMTPRHFAEAVIPWGTTTVVTDPHEIANVCGIDGVKYMHECSENLPMRQYILAPSCVPAVLNKENAGASFGADEIEELLKMDKIIGLAEVMDFLGVINNDPRMVSILNCVLEKNLFVQGHAPFLTGRNLSAYLCAGPTSDHESSVGFEVRDKIRCGMYVDAREGSIAKNVNEIIKNVKDFKYLTNLTFCTDDREPADILENGHLNNSVSTAIKSGMDPVDAIRSATLNTAREIGIENLGAIAPGYAADILLIDSLENPVPSAVFFDGKLTAQNGKLEVKIEDKSFDIENENTMHVNPLNESDFKIKAPIKNGKIKTSVIAYSKSGDLSTKLSVEELTVKDGYLDISNDPDLKFVAVINRHKDKNTRAFGVIRNFGTNTGTVGSTVSHDSHNLTIIYDTPQNALIAANDIIKMTGGLCCVNGGKVIADLSLPIAGLMSKKPCIELAPEVSKVKEALFSLGFSKSSSPLLKVTTVALPVIPDIKISDMGLIDVLKQEFVNLFEV